MRCTTVYVYTVVLNFKKKVFKWIHYEYNQIDVGGLLLLKMKLRTPDHSHSMLIFI